MMIISNHHIAKVQIWRLPSQKITTSKASIVNHNLYSLYRTHSYGVLQNQYFQRRTWINRLRIQFLSFRRNSLLRRLQRSFYNHSKDQKTQAKQGQNWNWRITATNFEVTELNVNAKSFNNQPRRRGSTW